MEKKPYGCLTIAGLVTAVLTVLVVVGVGLDQGDVLYSPGRLNARAGTALGGVSSHADLSSNCSACHTAFWQKASMADRCVICHKDIVTQWQNPVTLHGNLHLNNPGMTCRNCHTDHRGPAASLTDLPKIIVTHEVFGFALTAHQKQADGSPYQCKTCHTTGYTKFDQAVCTTCHMQIKAAFMQPHQKTFGATCLVCHDGIDSYGHTFNHSAVAFRLTGKHQLVDCGGCHTGASSIANLKAAPLVCSACHTKNDHHMGQFGSRCDQCHSTSAWLPATFDHSLSHFPLTGAHIGLVCTKCHLNGVFTGLPIACVSCHEKNDKHKGQFGSRCEACHSTAAWLPPTFDHARSKFPLTGAHTGLPCTRCHLNDNFIGVSIVCGACHADPPFHAGLFLGTPCSDCHTTFAWLPASYKGPHPGGCDGNCINHEGATCRDCHTVNLMTATCSKCHGGNNPGAGG